MKKNKKTNKVVGAFIGALINGGIMMNQPNFKNIVDCALNKKPQRIPVYDHNVSDVVMERITGKKFAHLFEQNADEYFKIYNSFFKDYGYDTVTYEGCVTAILPFGGALAHPMPGYIDGEEKFNTYPWNDIKALYINYFEKYFKALTKNMPQGMKAIGGVGNGVFEIAQDLVGYENLCVMGFEEPSLYEKIFVKIGDILCEIWEWLLHSFGDTFCVCRFGDDLGYKSNTMLSHDDIKIHIIPQYKRVIELIHSYNKPFLLHSCGNIFEVMDDIINVAKIDSKHSNEDQIALMSEWVARYGNKIGNFGGIDTDHLVRLENEKLVELVTDIYNLALNKNGGFAIGSGNSIPPYINDEKYLIYLNTVRRLRGEK